MFKELKYTHRATSCALRAVELGGGARWRERVERLVAAYPRSLAARQYEQMTAPIARVRGRMREVAELLVSSNKTAREIGETLGMAEGTVRVHIKHMNKILNVREPLRTRSPVPRIAAAQRNPLLRRERRFVRGEHLACTIRPREPLDRLSASGLRARIVFAP